MTDRRQEIEKLGLPIDLTRWICDVAVDDTPAVNSKRQAMFVRDQLAPIVVRPKRHDWQADPKGTPDRLDNYVHAVSIHWSKSVLLPVYYIDARSSIGCEFWLRHNWYDWKISVKSERPIPDVFMRLIQRGKTIHDVYFEGFEKDWIFGSYADNPCEFSLELYAESELTTFMMLLNQALRQGQGELKLFCVESAGFHVTAELQGKVAHTWSKTAADAYVLALEELDQTPQVITLIEALMPACKDDIWVRESRKALNDLAPDGESS